MRVRNAGIIHYTLFWHGNNGLQCAYFVNNGLQSVSINRYFLNITRKTVQVLQQEFIGRFRELTRGYAENLEPKTRGLRLNSIAESFSLKFLVCFSEISGYFSMKKKKRKVMRCGEVGWLESCVTREFPNTCQNKCIYKYSINPRYIKQWIICHFTRIYDWDLLDITVHEVN